MPGRGGVGLCIDRCIIEHNVCSAVNNTGQAAPRTGFFHYFNKHEVKLYYAIAYYIT